MNVQLPKKRKSHSRCVLSLLLALAIVWPALAPPASADSPLPQDRVPG